MTIPTEDHKFFMVVLDVDFGKWSQTEQAYRIAKMNDKWHKLTGKFVRWYAEDIGGLELLKTQIINLSNTRYGHYPMIFWNVPENAYGAKINRIKGMEHVLRDDRMLFCSDGEWNEKTFEQLERYTGQRSSRTVKDDVPDALSRLVQAMPRSTMLSPKEREHQAAQKELEYRKRILQAQHDQIFGSNQGGFGATYPYPYYDNDKPQPESNDPNSKFRRSILGNSGAWR
jgi:hypothetical protein